MIAVAAGFVVVFTENIVPSLQAFEVCYQLVPLSIQKKNKKITKMLFCSHEIKWNLKNCDRGP